MIKRLLTICAAAAALSASADTFDMLPTFGGGGWGDRTYDADTRTITYNDEWVGIGWWFGSGADAKDLSAYDEFVLETEESSIAYNIAIQYVEGGDNNTVSVTVPAGKTKGIAPLDPERKNAVQQIYIQNHAPGTITLTAAYLQNSVEVDPTAPVVLWEGSRTLAWSGENNTVEIAISDFVAAKTVAGDKIVIDYTSEDDNGFKMIYVNPDWEWVALPVMSTLEGYNAEYSTINLPSDKTSYSITLDEENAALCTNAANKKILLQGDKITVKKVSIVHAAAESALSNWYIGGEFNGWKNGAEGFAFSNTDTEGVYTFKTASLSGEFLIVWADEPGTPDWTKKICGVQGMETGTAYPYKENDNTNFSVKGILKEVTVTLDTNAKTILIEGTSSENQYTDIYLVGDFGEGWSEDTTDMPLRLKDGDTYTGTYKLTAETSYFKLKAGSYVYSTGGGDVAVELGKEYTTAKTGNAFSLPAGEYTFTYVMAKNADTGKLTVTKGAGIADITADDNAPVEFFNLQGIRVAQPEQGGIYIRRQGSKVQKVFVK